LAVRVRKNAELRKPEILKSFYKTIVEEGMEGASIGKVAKRMDIHPSLIMHYFSTKDNMMVELVDYIINEYQSLLNTLRIVKGNPQERLLKLIDLLWGDEWYALTDVSADFSVISVSFRNKEVHKQLHSMYSNLRKYLGKELRSFMNEGVIAKQDPVRTAEIIISVMEGYRHFKHFYIDKTSSESYKQDMKLAVLTILSYQGEYSRKIGNKDDHNTLNMQRG
jgi:AcrR family transcriptional regulator